MADVHNVFTAYLPSGVYGQVEQNLKVNKAPVSCRVGKQLRGLYGGHPGTGCYSTTLVSSGLSESSTAAPCKRTTPYKSYLCTRLTINNQHTPRGSLSTTDTPLRSAATIDPRSVVRRLALGPAPKLPVWLWIQLY